MIKMSAISLLSSELSGLSTEAKRKIPELRTAAEKSLQELKSLPTTSEQQISADLSRRPAFIDPFLIACATRNARFASSGLACLQRLVVIKGLPKSRLNETLDAFSAGAELGLDVQLKVLQALPSLVQNYADELHGGLLASALQVCASLENSHTQTVSGVAAATLQQLVTAVFDKVAIEDEQGNKIKPMVDVPGDGQPISLRPAAFDAYRVFRDLVLTAEGRQTKFVQLQSLSPESSLELIWSSINSHPRLFGVHVELNAVIRSHVLPLVTLALTDKLSYSITVRSLRILDLVLLRYLPKFPVECQVALNLITDILDGERTTTWKRVCAMEIIRNVFANGNTIVDAFMVYDCAESSKPVIQDLMSAFVRLSTEKPSVLGLGQQSTTPAKTASRVHQGVEPAVLEATGGMTGVISSALGASEHDEVGISSEWSFPRAACLEHLDKADPPSLPETYMCAMVLECLGNLSDTFARIILPLSVQHEQVKGSAASSDPTVQGTNHERNQTTRLSRSQSFRKRAVPLNPLEIQGTLAAKRAHAVAGLIEKCWPAILATSSTFLNATLEDQYYRNLIKSYQRFAQVAGILRLTTPRDALMTTLSKFAIPPHVLIASMSDGLKGSTVESPRVASNTKGLLSVDSLVGQTSSTTIDRERRPSSEPFRHTLSTRNLLCLRALLNLAIALGPTLNIAFNVVVDALRQADMILSTTPPQIGRTGGNNLQRESESPAGVQAFITEVAAVEAAVSRLLESTADYPDASFLDVLNAFCRLLKGSQPHAEIPSTPENIPSAPSTPIKTRSFSGLPGISMLTEMHDRDYQFVIPKLGMLAQLNVSRFASNDQLESGWKVLVDTLNDVAVNALRPREARRAAADIICKMSAAIVSEALQEDESSRALIQKRALEVLLELVDSIYDKEDEITSADHEIQGHTIDALCSTLERCGESLVAGWTKVIAILSSAFERLEKVPVKRHEPAGIDWDSITNDFVSLPVGRSAFAATQLVCSDFLAALPSDVIPSLIELLTRFLQQTDDLNVALTTVTTTLNISDFLFSSLSSHAMHDFIIDIEQKANVEQAICHQAPKSRSAQILMLLLRLREVTRRTQNNVKTATFQTICNIFQSHGDEMSPATWDLALRMVNLRIVADDASLYNRKERNSGKNDDGIFMPNLEMSKSIILGTSGILAQHIRLIEQVERLPSLWEAFLKTMESFLDTEQLALHAVVFNALAKILSQFTRGSALCATPSYRTVALWLNRIPCSVEDSTSHDSNQEAFIAYADTASELYRLTNESIDSSRLRKMMDNLYQCIKQSDGPHYGEDLKIMSPLQSKVLSLLKSLRTDLPNMPSRLIGIASQLATLHHETTAINTSRRGPTFVALVSESIHWLQSLVQEHIQTPEIIETGAALSAVQSCRRLVVEKYAYKAAYKGTPLWQSATSTALALSKSILDAIKGTEFDNKTRVSLLTEFVALTGGIVSARGVRTVHDQMKLYEDQLFDIESFRDLREILIPQLRDKDLPDEVRTKYCHYLFEASIIHATLDTINENGIPLPSRATTARRAHINQIAYAQRERMCYLCFSELVSLSLASEESFKMDKLAQAAMPLLQIRLAIPIRRYIADQPLRGRRPQPCSELEELLFCLDRIKQLGTESDLALIMPVQNDLSTTPPSLYPLLIKAVAVAGDEWSGSQKVLKSLHSVLETPRNVR
ncbi:Hypothetical protein R9X50_00245800 [Acrodontium crateriforme]|uniref:MON2 n=1 Tax=Acrodontium crateriforme TaxID=150365 RepID=A0AAQ3R912_9PEZI|nr:Hypothetical protein R9X50_00245800 [Acrodontium crateriforme]